MVIVVVGDKQKLEKPLSELHLPIYPLQLPRGRRNNKCRPGGRPHMSREYDYY